ncbi:MAG: hypothetical protein HY226_03315 [Candidatus Vogelbacteria bacterium]|nr:hypothetical protein [Candidatus Vogelbacteria bacterium]
MKPKLSFISLMVLVSFILPQLVSATIFQPGETLEPDCAPGSANCGIAAVASSLGTTTPIASSVLGVTATSTNSILATLRAFVGQVANILQIQDSTGANLFSIDAVGSLTVVGSTTLANLNLASLNGPLQANAGVVSATTSVGVAYGGTGVTSIPSYGNLLVGNSSGGYTLTATSSLGLGGSGGTVSSVALTTPTGLTVSGSPVTTSGTLAVSLDTGYVIPLQSTLDGKISVGTTSINSITTLLNLSLPATQLTNFGSPFYTFFNATTTSALTEGSNLYFTNNRVASVIAGTTTDALTQGATNKYYSTNLFAANLAGTTTTALPEGTNLYYTDNRVNSYINASSTIPKSYSANTFTGSNIFNGNLTFSSLNGPLQANAGVVSATTSVGVTYGGTGVSSFNQGWIYSPGDGNALTSSTSPTVNYVTATSTTATSTFPQLSVTSYFADAGTASTSVLRVSGHATLDDTVTLTDLTSCTDLATDASGNIACTGAARAASFATSSNSTVLTASEAEIMSPTTSPAISPRSTSNRILVSGQVLITSANVVIETATIRVRRGTGVCTGTQVGNDIKDYVAKAASNSQWAAFSFIDSPATTTSQAYTVCALESAADSSTVNNVLLNIIEVSASGADLAELYPTSDPSIVPGDVVSIDSTLLGGVKKSAGVNDSGVIGVVSIQPGLLLSDNTVNEPLAVPVALSGRVPVKVSTENGDINAGDYLTSSSIAGVAMKANGTGKVLGQALTSYQNDGVGTVIVFIKNFDLGGGILLGDVSQSMDSSGLTTLISTIQSEVARDPVAIFDKKISDGKQFLTDFLAARITAIRGYFDEVFSNKSHQKVLCVGDFTKDDETCIDKNKLDALLKNIDVPDIASPPAPINNSVVNEVATSTSLPVSTSEQTTEVPLMPTTELASTTPALAD